MKELIDLLGQPNEITNNSHRWNIGKYQFRVIPRPKKGNETFYLFSFVDEKGISKGGGHSNRISFVVEAAENQQRIVKREERKKLVPKQNSYHKEICL